MKKFLATLIASCLILGGCGGLEPKKVEPEITPSVPRHEINCDVPEGQRYKIKMEVGGHYEVLNESGETILRGNQGRDTVFLFAGQKLIVYDGKAEVIKPKNTVTPTVATTSPRLTVQEFDVRFIEILNSVAAKLGVAGGEMGAPEVQADGAYKIYVYPLGDGLKMSEITLSDVIKKVDITAATATRDNLLTALIVFDAAVRSFSENVSVDEIHRELELDGNILSSPTKTNSVKLNGIKYEKKITDGNGITLSVAE